jgi:hypothetical protein
METIHIFDEFPGLPSRLSHDKFIQKRTRLEPLVFDILKQKYWTPLDIFWQTHKVPTEAEANKCVVIVERRIHENLAFLIRNVAYFASTWAITIVCSDINLEYCKALIMGKNIRLLPLWEGSPGRDEARSEYNTLLKSVTFYEKFASEHLCIVQTDSYFRKKVPDNILEYDYIGAPISWDYSMAIGGTSFRKRDSMIDICKNFKENIDGEDCFISKGIVELGYRMPHYSEGVTYIVESSLYYDPIAIHQWWTYFYRDIDNADYIFKSLLTLDTYL